MQQLVQKLYDWLAISDPLQKSDVIFLFGGPSIHTPKKGFELYKKGLADRVVCAGDTGTFDDSGWGRPSADVFAEYLIDNGLDKKDLIIQNRSTNTLEDVIFTVPILQEKRLSHQKLILVSIPVHQRRASATFQQQYPKLNYLNSPCDEVLPSQLSGGDLHKLGIRCLQEYDRIIGYAEKGDTKRQLIPEETKEAYLKLKSELKYKS